MPELATFGKYIILEEIGRGGFGIVYKARDQALERVVALKVLHPQLAVDPQFSENFRREARIAAGLEHPNVLVLYETGEVNGRYYLAMRYYAGGSLADRLKAGPLSFEQAWPIFRQVCAGVQVVHAAGMVHRDLKPQNILFDANGQAVVSDFGLARAMSSSLSASSHTAGVGTPFYRAPELWRDQPATPACDVYSLGCILAEMLTGRSPFSANTPDGVLTRHLIDGPEFGPNWPPTNTPPAVVALVQRALARDPAQRPLDAATLAAELETKLRPAPVSEKSEAPASPIPQLKPAPGQVVGNDAKQSSQVLPPTGDASFRRGKPNKPGVSFKSISAAPLEMEATPLSEEPEVEVLSAPTSSQPVSEKTGSSRGFWVWAVIIAFFAFLWMASSGVFNQPARIVTSQPVSATSVSPQTTAIVITSSITPTVVPTPTRFIPYGKPLNILWIDDCDPRKDPTFCRESSDLKVFDEFYGVIATLHATLSYKVPVSQSDLTLYDVVIANFCDAASHEEVIGWLNSYVTSGGSVIALGDNFCIVGGKNGKNWSSAQAATLLTQNWGILFTDEDDSTSRWALPTFVHPLNQSISKIYSSRHAYLTIKSPSQVIAQMGDKPFIGLYDQMGTVVAIPYVGFHWGIDARPEIANSDNFTFWYNMLNWLSEQSRNKRK